MILMLSKVHCRHTGISEVVMVLPTAHTNTIFYSAPWLKRRVRLFNRFIATVAQGKRQSGPG